MKKKNNGVSAKHERGALQPVNDRPPANSDGRPANKRPGSVAAPRGRRLSVLFSNDRKLLESFFSNGSPTPSGRAGCWVGTGTVLDSVGSNAPPSAVWIGGEMKTA